MLAVKRTAGVDIDGSTGNTTEIVSTINTARNSACDAGNVGLRYCAVTDAAIGQFVRQDGLAIGKTGLAGAAIRAGQSPGPAIAKLNGTTDIVDLG